MIEYLSDGTNDAIPCAAEPNAIEPIREKEMTMTRHLKMLHQLVRGDIPYPPAAAQTGLILQEIEPGKSVVSLDVAPQHQNPYGNMAGGVLATLADITMAMAHDSLLAEDEDGTTVEMKINFIKPVRQGTLRAVGRVITQGRTLRVAECDIFNADQVLVARSSGTFMVLRDRYGAS